MRGQRAKRAAHHRVALTPGCRMGTARMPRCRLRLSTCLPGLAFLRICRQGRITGSALWTNSTTQRPALISCDWRESSPRLRAKGLGLAIKRNSVAKLVRMIKHADLRLGLGLGSDPIPPRSARTFWYHESYFLFGNAKELAGYRKSNGESCLSQST